MAGIAEVRLFDKGGGLVTVVTQDARTGVACRRGIRAAGGPRRSSAFRLPVWARRQAGPASSATPALVSCAFRITCASFL